MTLGSGCGSKTLIRIGGGNLKSLVVYVFLAISAYMTLRGLFGQFRVSVLQPVAVNLEAYGIKGQDLPSLLASGTADFNTVRTAIAGIVAAALLLFSAVSMLALYLIQCANLDQLKGVGLLGKLLPLLAALLMFLGSV